MKSRWQETKSKSTWHFNPNAQSDDFIKVCTFIGDWSSSIKNLINKTETNTWGECKSANNTNFCIADPDDGAVNDLINAGADPKQEIFERTSAQSEPVFVQIADTLGLLNYELNFQPQKSGQMAHMHTDNLGSAGRDPMNKKEFRRFVVMLDDWQYGQTFLIGNQYWKWNKGQCISWDWKNTPHGTANFGWDIRPMLQITGEVTPKTKELLNSASFENYIQINQ